MLNHTTSTTESPVLSPNNHDRIVYTVKEIAAMLHTNAAFIYRLISLGLLPALKLGSIRVRRVALEDFLSKYEGYDLSDPENIKTLAQQKLDEELATA